MREGRAYSLLGNVSTNDEVENLGIAQSHNLPIETTLLLDSF
jgi:hypothetical protein